MMQVSAQGIRKAHTNVDIHADTCFPLQDYSSAMVATRHKKLLASQLGNLCSRILSLSLNPLQKIPRRPPLDNVSQDDSALNLRLQVLPEAVDRAMTNYKTAHATQAIFEAIAEVP